jgi:exodeoxyribonuclease VII large subunit
VAVLSRRLQSTLEGAFTEPVWVEGEVVGARHAATGHLYFTLKDEKASAAVDAVVYKIDMGPRTRELVRDGARLVVLARVSYFVPRGKLQISVLRVNAAGRGALLEAIEQRKKQLAAEGLFARERKRPLPPDPRVIGVVSSVKGAAIHDIVKVADRRGGARILLCPTQVQGPDAPRSIAWALEMLSRVRDVDVIIVARGGGSADDLAAWNDEGVVRAIAGARVPVVSAIGHEVDVTLADFVADARAATPSQAAEMVVSDRASRRATLEHLRTRLVRAARSRIVARSARTSDLGKRLSRLHPGVVLAERQARVLALRERMLAAMRGDLHEWRNELGGNAARLDAMSPLAVLSRGYAIATKDGRAIRTADDVAAGDTIEVRAHAARIEATVVRVK